MILTCWDRSFLFGDSRPRLRGVRTASIIEDDSANAFVACAADFVSGKYIINLLSQGHCVLSYHMLGRALGLIETRGLIGAIVATDAAAKGAAVVITSVELTDATFLTLKIEGDPTRLAQVFDNLLSNATKYAPDSTINITLSTQDDHAHIEFSDQGPGIPTDDLPNIFTRFYRVPNHNQSVRGTGLGLFICRQIINAHHGEITAVSKLGEGTTFHIYLPILNHKTGEDNQES